MRYGHSVRGFSAGVLVGVLVGSAGIALAAFGYSGWQKFSDDFKVGYLTGFLDMANLTRNLQPGGYVDERYPYLPQVKPRMWVNEINSLYSKPENQSLAMTSMLQLAANELAEKTPKPITPQQRLRDKLEQQLAAHKKDQEAKATAEQGPAALVAKPKVVAPHAPSRVWPRKWCRCDGKNPKAARAEKRARAAAAKKAAGGSATAPAAGAAPAIKTPPNQAPAANGSPPPSRTPPSAPPPATAAPK